MPYCGRYSTAGDVRGDGGAGLRVQWPGFRRLHPMGQEEAAQAMHSRDSPAVVVDLDGWIGDDPPRRLMARRDIHRDIRRDIGADRYTSRHCDDAPTCIPITSQLHTN